MAKAPKPRRRPVRKPYREVSVRIPGELIDYVSRGIGWWGRDEEEVIVWMVRSYICDHEESNRRLPELEAEIAALKAKRERSAPPPTSPEREKNEPKMVHAASH